MNKESFKNLKELELYFSKNHHRHSCKIANLIALANFQPQSGNAMVKEWAKDENALLKIKDANNGSDVEVLSGASSVFKGTKIDHLKDGSVLMAFPWAITGNDKPGGYFKSVKESYNEKALDFLSENRKKETMGGYSVYLQKLLGMASGGFSDEMLASNTMIKSLYIVPADTEVVIIDNFAFEGGVTYSEVFDLITDLATIGLTLGAAAFSGGTSVAATVAVRLSQAARGANVLNILNNIYARNGVQAVLGILALGLNLSNTKSLTVFYNRYIAGSGAQILSSVPARFLYILEALVGIVSVILDRFVEDVDDAIAGYIEEAFGTKDVGEDQLATIRMSQDPIHQMITIYQDNGGRPGMARNFSAGVGPVMKKFQKSLPN